MLIERIESCAALRTPMDQSLLKDGRHISRMLYMPGILSWFH